GFLDDYAFTIEAFLMLYETTFDEQWVTESKRLADYCLECFFDADEGVFYYTSNQEKTFIARKYELMDNVIPASNSALFRCLHKLGSIFEKSAYQDFVYGALTRLLPQITAHGTAFSNWAILLLHEIQGWNEI